MLHIARHKKTTVLARILLRLIIPLFLLAVIIAAMQLTIQLRIMNEFLEIKSRLALSDIHKVLTAEIKKQPDLNDPAPLKEKMDKLIQAYEISHIQMIDVFDKRLLFEDNSIPWTPVDNQALEESLHEKQLGRAYHAKVNAQNKQLMAYIPLKAADSDKTWVARVVFSLATMQDALSKSRGSLAVILCMIIFVGILIGRGLAKSIVDPIRQLNEGTREVIKGKLGTHVTLNTGDEIEMLAQTFNQMSDAMKEVKQRAEEANPLTRLPGNDTIFQEINKRIFERQKFVFFHVDLNRFKVFNDHFGLGRGDMAIKKTAEILLKAIREKGASDDFVGHHGGDDFVMITRPQKAKDVAERVCKLFESEVLTAIYRKDDLDLGYTLHQDRRRFTETGEDVTVKFPLLSVGLAGVSNAKKDFADYFECMTRGIEVKKEVKKKDESSYIIQE